MRLWEELLLIFGLSMDGFAASVCLGMELGRKKYPPIILSISGCHISLLLLGYALGAGVSGLLDGVFPWISGVILGLLGLNMLRSAGEEAPKPRGGGVLSIGALAFATSIDAMTVGVALALMEVPGWHAALYTALVMGTLSFIGAFLGGRLGAKYRFGARLSGGGILTLLGLKALLEALGVTV